jgi:microcystin-dependent protein
MAEPFIGEIKIIAWDWAPRGWAFCDGQILAIAQNQALFSILGTVYGGNGTTTFGLPDMRGRTPLQFAPNYALGEKSGEEAHTLLVTELPSHPHGATGSSNAADQTTPANNFWAVTGTYTAYAQNGNKTMAQQAVGQTGGNQPHPNLSPYLTMNFIIALVGIYPPRD